MKRYFRYIFLTLILGIMAMSCVEEMDVPQPKPGNDAVTLVPRVKSFSNQYVTKSDYSTDETKITKLAVLVFDSNTEPKLVHIEEASGENITSLRLNKSLLNKCDVTKATIVMIANVDLANVKNSEETSIKDANADTTLELDDLNDYSFHFTDDQTVVTSLGDGFNGFPMIGISDPLDLSSSVDHSTGLQVNLQILYAKVNFSISVAPGTENQNYTVVTPSFALSGYSVHNVSKRTPYTQPTGATVSTDYAYTGEDAFDGSAEGTTDLNGDAVSFTFYVAESRYAHNSTLQGVYPDDSWLTTTHYDNLKQQYKPKIANLATGTPSAGLATYVTVSGTYKDYRGTNWTVNYKVYLGKDNSQNFEVDRNSEYTNHLTIKGIRNNYSYSDNAQSVWVDHRVNVSTGDLAGNVTITRETLIDSHIEVRPLRVKWTGNEYDGVRVYLPTDSNGNLIDWIGIERYTGNNNVEASVYCYAVDKSTGERIPTGKRKYFTTSLIEELQNKKGEYGIKEDNGKKYIYLLNGECAWIYFDEHTGAANRDAVLKLDFYTKSGSINPVEYKIKQRGLQTVGGYAIESYEEYLHTYDSDDKYNLSTSPVDYTQQGLAWGFVDHKLSQNTLVSTTDVPTTLLKNQMIKQYAYDYFHESDNTNSRYRYKYTKASGSWANASFGTGLTFTDVASTNRYITIKDMGTIPENAYQYCLSKNKFEADDFGNISMTINWYLPDVYEMQAILNASQSGDTPVDLDSEAYYWSSQPSFSTAGTYYINESTDNARAASIQEGISDRPRENQHRIRCVYASNGIDLDEEDMEDRVPDGVGGNYVVYMKAWNNGGYGYFNYLLPAADTRESSTDWVYNDDRGTNYPNKDNAGSISGEKFKYIKTTDKDGNPIEGFDVNPGEDWDKWTNSTEEGDPDGKPDGWTEFIYWGSNTGYYSTLTTYPGLSAYTLDKYRYGDAYKPTTTPKSGTQTVTNDTIIVLDKKLPPASDLKTLDHLSNGSMLNISFDQSKGTTQPAFLYDQLVSGTSSVNTRNWIKPEYQLKEYPLDPEEYTKEAGGEGSETGISTGTSEIQQASENSARQNAFDGTTDVSTISNQVDGAYPKAKNDAKAKLDDILKDYPTSEGWKHSTIQYTELEWNIPNPNISWTEPIVETGSYRIPLVGTRYYTKKVTITCTVKVTASVTVSKPSVDTVFVQVDGTGKWGDPVPKSTPLTPAINTDEMRMYCGNSFTISLSEAAKQQGYEITKVKVHYLGGNLVDEYGTLNADKAYARFVDSEITLPTESKTVNDIGSTETLQLSGMDYNENQNDGTGTHEWSGSGRESVTLVLADYLVATNLSGLNLVYVYQYTNTPRQPGKYIVVDQIEVKCSKKKNATFDFKQIYIDSGSLETSGCTVKHITVTAEGGTEEIPTAITADGLKLYSGSKVTFKALDGYVINSITGDPDLTFNGSQQTVEFTDLPEKTISEQIVVLYSKEDNV